MCRVNSDFHVSHVLKRSTCTFVDVAFVQHSAQNKIESMQNLWVGKLKTAVL